MKDQHEKIKGYRDLSQEEIDLMNEVKEMAAKVGELVDNLSQDNRLDQRWTHIGATDLQKGFMALTRSIAKPDFF